MSNPDKDEIEPCFWGGFKWDSSPDALARCEEYNRIAEQGAKKLKLEFDDEAKRLFAILPFLNMPDNW